MARILQGHHSFQGSGILGCILVYVLQFPISFIKKGELESWWQQTVIKVMDIFFNTLGLVTTVNCFRGYWFLLDEYFLPDDYEASLVLAAVLGALILMALHCTCSLHAGIYRDEHGSELLVEFYYSTHYYLKVTPYTIVRAGQKLDSLPSLDF